MLDNTIDYMNIQQLGDKRHLNKGKQQQTKYCPKQPDLILTQHVCVWGWVFKSYVHTYKTLFFIQTILLSKIKTCYIYICMCKDKILYKIMLDWLIVKCPFGFIMYVSCSKCTFAKFHVVRTFFEKNVIDQHTNKCEKKIYKKLTELYGYVISFQ